MSNIRIYIHAVWVTHWRRTFLNKNNKDLLCRHIMEYAESNEIHLLKINGWENHLHGLISLGAEQNIANVMNLIKGESSYWANRNLELPKKFKWGHEYYGTSVSPLRLNIVKVYINNQEKNHKKISFEDELRKFTEPDKNEGLENKSSEK